MNTITMMKQPAANAVRGVVQASRLGREDTVMTDPSEPRRKLNGDGRLRGRKAVPATL